MTARDGSALPGPSDTAGEIDVLHVDDRAFPEMACAFLERESDRITAHVATSASDADQAAIASMVAAYQRLPARSRLPHAR